jgi:hypothetical protein
MSRQDAFDRLVQLGMRAGRLRVSDLGRILPIETMTVNEITEIVARLEGAGIAVEIDAELEAPSHRKAASDSEAIPKQSSPSGAMSLDHARLQALASSIKAKELQARSPQPQGIKESGTVFVIAAAGILIGLVLVAWGFGWA